MKAPQEKKVSQATILRIALERGLSRANAAVFSEIAYWEQVDGGVEVRGRRLRWRSAQEIGAALGYSARTVQRSLQFLRKHELIGSQVIWSPARMGERVNGFWLASEGAILLREAKSERSDRQPRLRPPVASERDIASVSEKADWPDRMRQIDRITYSDDIPPRRAAGTDHFLEGEARRAFLRLENFREKEVGAFFGQFTRERFETKNEESIKAFWEGLSKASEVLLGKNIEAWNGTVAKRASSFLAPFASSVTPRFMPMDAALAAFWALCDPMRYFELIHRASGKWPEGRQVNSYLLGTYGYLILNEMKDAARQPLHLQATENAPAEFLAGDF